MAKTTPRKRNWRSNDDSALRSFIVRPNAESLHPSAETVLAAVCGNPMSRSIIDSYAFRFPVRVMTEVLQ